MYSGASSQVVARKLASQKINSDNRACDIDVMWCRITHFEAKARKKQRSHFHSFYELHLVLEGETAFDFADKQVTVKSGQFLLIPPDIRHTRCEFTKPFVVFALGFSVRFRTNNLNGLQMKQAFDLLLECNTLPCTERMLQYVQHIDESTQCDFPALSAVVESYLQLLCLEITRLICPLQSQHNIRSGFADTDQHYRQIREYITQHLSEKLTSDSIAAAFFLSAAHLNRILKRNYNVTVKQLIHELKFQRIKELLEETTYDLAQIAEQTGFSNEYNMSRFFKATEGIPPGIYRRNLKSF